MLQVERQTILPGFFHLPLVIGIGCEDKLFTLHTALVDLAAAERRTDERDAPVTRLQAGFHLTGREHAFISENVLRHLLELRRCVDVPAVRCGIAYHIHGLGLNGFDDGSIGLTQILGRHGPVAQVERQSILTGIGHAPFVVGITGMHGKLGIGDGRFRNLGASHQRTYERSIPTAGGQTELDLACEELSLPREHKRIVGRCLQWRGVADVPSVGCGVAHHVEGLSLDGQFALDDVQVFLALARRQTCCQHKAGYCGKQTIQFHILTLNYELLTMNS